MSDTQPVKATNIVQRLFCVTISPLPADGDCWTSDGSTLTLDLNRVPELSSPGRSIRIEDDRLPDRLLIVHADDGSFHAYRNRCACGGFRIDPVPGEAKIRCCTPMASTYDLEGKPTGSHPPQSIEVLGLSLADNVLTIDISPLSDPAPHLRK